MAASMAGLRFAWVARRHWSRLTRRRQTEQRFRPRPHTEKGVLQSSQMQTIHASSRYSEMR